MYGAPLYGIKTGFNQAFVIDTPTRNRLVTQDPKSAELLVPLLRGENVKRWRIEPDGLFLINTSKGSVDIDAYPAIRDWLLPFKPQLESRATKQEWFELQQAQLAYQTAFARPKVIWPQFIRQPEFCLDAKGLFPINKCYLFSTDDFALVSLLNSKCLWFCFRSISVIKSGGFHEATAQHVGPLPYPDLSADAQDQLIKLGKSCTKAGADCFDVQSDVRHRILDLAPPDRTRLSRKLNEWWTLDFAAFRDEVKRAFRTEIPVQERGEWEAYLAKHAAEVRTLDAEIEQAEREIDAIVYRLFELTPDEIALLEASIAGQY